MGKINATRVFLGGLAAGVVLNITDFLLWGVIMKDDVAAVMQRLSLPGEPPLALFVTLDFAFGIWLMWLYAAIRPRFGPGPRTALIAGLYMWIGFGVLHALTEMWLGVFSTRMWVIGLIGMLIALPLAAMAGGKFYQES